MTAVELMPIHAFLQDHFLVEKGLRNYWDIPPRFFAPERPSCPPARCRRSARRVRRLHAAGIEVILDVVYNPHLRRQ